MADYQKMYLMLFNKITDVIGELEEVQQMTEEMYMDKYSVQISSLSEQKIRKGQ